MPPRSNRTTLPTSQRDAALFYAREFDWKVFPVQERGKTPLNEHGHLDATTDAEQIRDWWERWPDANIGRPASSRLFILDVDADKGGYESLAALEAEHGALPETLVAKTGGGGRHYYWRTGPGANIPNSAGLLGPGLDVRGRDEQGRGGYVVLPPSIHSSGARYEWLDERRLRERITTAPGWLITLAKDRPSVHQGTQNGQAVAADGAPIEQGQRNSTLASLAGGMRRRGMDAAEIEAALRAVNERRVQPPLPDSDVVKIAASVARYQPAPPPKPGSPEQNGQGRPSNGAPERGLRVSWGPTIKTEPMQFLWRGYVPLGNLGLLAGPPKVGKSTVAVDLMARVSRGAAMPDGSPGREGRVLLIAPEDSEGEALARYLEAGGDPERFGVVWEDMEDPDAQVPPTFPDRLAELERLIRQHSVLLVVIDNLDRVVGRKLEMNKAKDVTEVLAPLQGVAKRTGAAILAIEHTRKAGAGDPLDAVLGSRKVTGVARFVAFVVRDQEDPRRRLFGVRGNYTAEDDGTLSFTMSANGSGSARIHWEGASGVSLQDAFRGDIEGQGGALGEAISWLRDFLRDGGRERKEIVAEATEYGISKWALEEARRRLGIKPERLVHEQGRPTIWELPATERGDEVSPGGHDLEGPGETRPGERIGGLSWDDTPQTNVSPGIVRSQVKPSESGQPTTESGRQVPSEAAQRTLPTLTAQPPRALCYECSGCHKRRPSAVDLTKERHRGCPSDAPDPRFYYNPNANCAEPLDASNTELAAA